MFTRIGGSGAGLAQLDAAPRSRSATGPAVVDGPATAPPPGDWLPARAPRRGTASGSATTAGPQRRKRVSEACPSGGATPHRSPSAPPKHRAQGNLIIPQYMSKTRRGGESSGRRGHSAPPAYTSGCGIPPETLDSAFPIPLLAIRSHGESRCLTHDTRSEARFTAGAGTADADAGSRRRGELSAR